ncbi:MAG: CheR family methyltransferase, partial [Planctomycetia bacterium]
MTVFPELREAPLVWSALLRLIEERAGLRLGEVPTADVADRIARAMAKTGCRDPREYLELVRGDETRYAGLMEELVVCETYFFRDRSQFDFLVGQALPALAALRNEIGLHRPLRVWSAACSTGEEAYSLAATLLRFGWYDARVLGTDLSTHVLGVARRGVYGSWSLRGDGAPLAADFLEPIGATPSGKPRWKVADLVRNRVDFQPYNLAGPD